jgi:hypothetical protein
MLNEPQKAAQFTRQTLSFWTSFVPKHTNDCNEGRVHTASAPKLPMTDRRNFLVVHPAPVAVHGVVSWCCNHCERILLKYAATANYESHSTGTQTYKLWRGRFKSHRDVREHLLADHHLVVQDSKVWSRNEELWSHGHRAITDGEDVWRYGQCLHTEYPAFEGLVCQSQSAWPSVSAIPGHTPHYRSTVWYHGSHRQDGAVEHWTWAYCEYAHRYFHSKSVLSNFYHRRSEIQGTEPPKVMPVSEQHEWNPAW